MIVIVLSLEVAILFISQYRKKREIRLRLSIGLFFIILSFAFIVLFIMRYVVSFPLLINIYNVLLALSMFTFSFRTEQEYGKRMKTRRIFTYICLCIMPVALLIPPEYPIYYVVLIANGIVATFPALFLAFFLKFYRGQLKRRMEIALVGAILTLMGNYGIGYQFGLFLTDWFSTEWNIFLFIASRVSITIGHLLVFYGFTEDIFLESDWRKYLMEYIIIENKTRKTLFYKNLFYTPSTGDIPDTALFSGGIVGIMSMIQEFTQSQKELKVIDKGSIKLLIERGKQVTVVFVVKENLSILRFLLRKTVEDFENTFGVFLKKPWDSNIEDFKATETIIDQLFKRF